MKVVADENIPFVREGFREFGDVVAVPGRAIDAETVKAADVLLVRSITKVGERLLDGSSVRFVGTATIGEDHIDTQYLADRGIGFASAPGSNANSVAEYVVAALFALAERFDLALDKQELGIVGVGNVGARVLDKASALGMPCVPNDPPRARLERSGTVPSYLGLPARARLGPSPFFRPIEAVFDCDIVTLHVPLTYEGPDATYHLADASFYSKMKPGAILINTSRGPVVDSDALKYAIDANRLGACVLDVWEGEPNVDVALLERATIATPHIAGYSFDGKINGTRMVYEAACAFFGIEATWDPASLLPSPECPKLTVDAQTDPQRAAACAVAAVYDIMRDDASMRTICSVPPPEHAKRFDRLRSEYPRRREFFNTRVRVTFENVPLERTLSGLGFVVEDA